MIFIAPSIKKTDFAFSVNHNGKKIYFLRVKLVLGFVSPFFFT